MVKKTKVITILFLNIYKFYTKSFVLKVQ